MAAHHSPTFLQLVLNGLMAGAILTAPAIGFTAIYAVLRFPEFRGRLARNDRRVRRLRRQCHAAAARWCRPRSSPSWPPAWSAWPATALVLRPLRRNGLITATIASVALTIALENLVRLGFGNSLRDYDLPILRDWRFGGLRVGPQQLEDLAISAVAVLALFAFLRFTRIGKAMRAVADNPTLAAIKGIDADLDRRTSSTSSRWAWPGWAACCSGWTPRSIR